MRLTSDAHELWPPDQDLGWLHVNAGADRARRITSPGPAFIIDLPNKPRMRDGADFLNNSRCVDRREKALRNKFLNQLLRGAQRGPTSGR